MKSRIKKQDIYLWRMTQIANRINEHNERRQEHKTSGQAALHPEWFSKWEADELEKRKAFATQMQTVTP